MVRNAKNFKGLHGSGREILPDIIENSFRLRSRNNYDYFKTICEFLRDSSDSFAPLAVKWNDALIIYLFSFAGVVSVDYLRFVPSWISGFSDVAIDFGQC